MHGRTNTHAKAQPTSTLTRTPTLTPPQDARKRACMTSTRTGLGSGIHASTHKHVHARLHARTHTRTCTRTHMRSLAKTHAHAGTGTCTRTCTQLEQKHAHTLCLLPCSLAPSLSAPLCVPRAELSMLLCDRCAPRRPPISSLPMMSARCDSSTMRQRRSRRLSRMFRSSPYHAT